ncbi:adenosine deaminase [Suicoccus acidiformans]|uniref:adenosine deaminase n=1 Tax=Suicoccus acidiformans TaxID=2036206 RepID=A0A347WLT0_9LACT|nr:adenosine deaminase [Suicoccus acidiformans]AXY26037.1 adenosine deaminase [Suicoccus acidiformans]
MEKYIEAMPKAELHCHLDGSVPMATLQELATEAGLPSDYVDGVRVPDKCEDLADYLKSFDVILPLLQSKGNLERATYAIIAEVALENVKYLELRFAPLLHQEEGLSLEEIFQAVEAGIERGQRDYDVNVNLLVCCMRHHDEATNLALVEAVANLNPNLVVGFDFAGNEVDGANDHIQPITDQIHQQGYQLTLHSGECGCGHNIAQAVRLGSKRVGHGTAIKDDPALMALAQEQALMIEMCPTSNYQTNAVKTYEELPLLALLERDIPVSINTDNRTVSNTNLTQEFKKVQQLFNLSKEHLDRLSLNAIRHSFALEETKIKVEADMLAFHRK